MENKSKFRPPHVKMHVCSSRPPGNVVPLEWSLHFHFLVTATNLIVLFHKGYSHFQLQQEVAFRVENLQLAQRPQVGSWSACQD